AGLSRLRRGRHVSFANDVKQTAHRVQADDPFLDGTVTRESERATATRPGRGPSLSRARRTDLLQGLGAICQPSEPQAWQRSRARSRSATAASLTTADGNLSATGCA